MLKRSFNISFIMLLLLNINVFAATGNLFSITQSGSALQQPVSITLCLDISGNIPLSCQNYTINNDTLSIITNIPNHTYHNAGIRVNTSGYTYTPGTTGSSGYIPLATISTTQSANGSVASAILTAAGQDSTTNLPLLYQSTDAGSTWIAITTTSNLGLFNSTSCSGTGSSAICTAAGQDSTTNLPLLYQSTNGGSTWSAITTTSNLGFFNSTSCSGTGSSAICTAAGQDSTTNLPLLYQSTNGGSTWSAITTASDQGFFNSTSCVF